MVSVALAVSGTPTEFDAVKGSASNTIRGNVTQILTPGSARYFSYDVTGQVNTGSDATGTGATASYTSTTNFAAPGATTPLAGTPDVMNGHTPAQTGASSLTSSYGYTSALALASSAMPNGATTSQTFNSSTGLLSQSVSVHGASTSYAYAFNPTVVTASTNAHWTKSYKDGFGRDLAVETGTGTTIVSHVANVYGPCACSPLGKLKQSSLPYALDASGNVTASDGTANVAWNTWTFDGIGRTVTQTAPDGSPTGYVYKGNTTKVTDPAGNWKRYTNDVLGNLTTVEEPNPQYGQADNAATNFVTSYTYDIEGHLTGVAMPRAGYTQTRSFSYDLTTGRLMSVTNPESGTVSYTYYASGRLQQKLDAKGQKVVYSYDALGRLVYIDRYPAGATNYDPCQSTMLSYGLSNWAGNVAGRLQQAVTGAYWAGQYGDTVTCGGQSMWEYFSYTAGGLLTSKSYQFSAPFALSITPPIFALSNWGMGFWYDNEGHQSGYNTFNYTLDAMGRPTALTGYDGTVWVKNAAYGPGGELKTMQYLTNSGTYYTENRTWNNRTQLTELQSSGTGLTGMDLQYGYPAAGVNNGRIAKVTDALSGEQIAYTYDALNRMAKAETVQNQTTYPSAPWWGQSFGYDGFGNLQSKTQTTGHPATSMSLSVDPATNHILNSGFAYDANGNMTSVAAAPSNITIGYDVENRTGGFYFDQNNQPLNRGGGWNVYGLRGERLGTTYFQQSLVTDQNGQIIGVIEWPVPGTRNIYFGSRLIQSNGVTVVTDQIGSVRANENGEKFEYYPYGEEVTVHNPQDREKFGTYTRESWSGLDYANQRYYASAYGAFTSADRYVASAGVGEPGSWNRYSYVGGDPVGLSDPSGRFACTLDGVSINCSDVIPDCRFAGDQGFVATPDGRLVACMISSGVPPPAGAGDVTHKPSQSPVCDLRVQYRGVDLPGVGLVAGHSYLHYISSAGVDKVIEGYEDVSGLLLGSIDDHGLDADNKKSDHFFGDITGSFVCNWFDLLTAGIAQINGARITYRDFGPNSNSAAAYLLRQLPNVIPPWIGNVPWGLFGWNTPLPGLN